MATTVTVTIGEVVCTPVPYHAFRVGPFAMTLDLEGLSLERAEAAIRKMREMLVRQQREEYQAAKEFFHREWRVGERG